MLQNCRKGYKIYQRLLLQPHLMLNSKKNGLVFYVTMSQQLCDASRILKSEACI